MKKTLLAFVVVAAAVQTQAQTCTLDPASGATLKYISEIDLNYNKWVDKIETGRVYITSQTTGEKTYCNGFTIFTDYSKYMMGATLSFPKISTPGEYTLTVEAKAVVPWFETDPTNEAVTATYTVDPYAEEQTIFSNYYLTPDPATQLAKLSSVGINFPKVGYYDTVEIDNARKQEIRLTGAGKTYYCQSLSGSYGNYSLSFAAEPGATEEAVITTPGEYTLTLPAGLFTNGAADPGELKGSPAIEATYTVSDDIEFPYTTDPADGAYLSIASLTNVAVKINFGNEVSSVSLDSAIEGAGWTVSLNGRGLERVANVNTEEGYLIEKFGTSLSVYVSKSLITEESLLSIRADKGAFTVDGIASPEIECQVTYTPPKEFTMEYEPAPQTPVNSLKEITVIFTNARTIEKPYYCYPNDGKLTSIRPGSTAIKSTDVQVFGAEGEKAPRLVVTFPDGMADDRYVFSFKKGLLLLDGQDSPALEAMFFLDSNAVGIGEAEADSFRFSTPGAGQLLVENPAGRVVSLYSADGRRMAAGSDRAILFRAEPGIYLLSDGVRTLRVKL